MKKEVQASKFSFLEKKTQEIQKLLRLLKEKEDTISEQDRNNILEAIETIKQKTPMEMTENSPKKDSVRLRIMKIRGSYSPRSEENQENMSYVTSLKDSEIMGRLMHF